MKTPTRSTALASVLLASLAGCATSAPRPGAKAAPASAAAPAEPAEAITARAQRLFDEAVRAEEEQRKLKVPTDWPYLERKWRGALSAGEIAEARHNLAVALEAQGRLVEARTEYERALQAKPSLRQAAVNLGVLLEKQGDVRGAAESYRAVVRDHPEDAVARERLAALYLAAGQYDDAWRLAREALMREPRSVAAYKVLVQVALQRKDLDLAKLVAMRAQKLDDRDPDLPFHVGRILAKEGDDAAAAAQFRRALALREDYLPARHALLAAAIEKRAWGGVAEQAAAIAALEPGSAGVHLAHGVALRHLGKAEEALAALDRAERLGGGRLPEVHLARGVVHARLKSDCEPALAELAAYLRQAGPMPPEGQAVTRLQRECASILEENRKAMEAARQMQEEAARGKGTPVEGGTPTSPSSGSR